MLRGCAAVRSENMPTDEDAQSGCVVVLYLLYVHVMHGVAVRLHGWITDITDPSEKVRT